MLTVSLSSCGLDDRTRQPFGHLLSKLFSNTFLTASTHYLSFTFFTSRPNYILSQQQHWLAPPFPLHLSRFFPYPYPCSPTPFSSSHLVLVTPLAQSFFFSVILFDPIPRVISHNCHLFLSGQAVTCGTNNSPYYCSTSRLTGHILIPHMTLSSSPCVEAAQLIDSYSSFPLPDSVNHAPYNVCTWSGTISILVLYQFTILSQQSLFLPI